jgi:hypothetical protein
MTIDNHARAMIVLDQLKAALPLPARLTPELQASLSGANRAKLVPAGCTIIGLHYMGDEGSVTCKLDLGPAINKEAYVSITHLRFDARLPLARVIAAYQKHQVKRLRRQPP